MKRLFLAVLFFAVLIAVWEWAFRAKIWSPVLLPAPQQVAEYLKTTVTDGTLVQATVITMRRLLIGYVIGLIGGLPLGLLTARWKVFHDTVGTLALGLQTLPSVCWVPLALLWFGQTEAAMLFVVVMGTLWSVVIATDTGVRHVPPIYRRAALTMGSKRLHIWLKVILPAALPFIVSGMKQRVALARALAPNPRVLLMDEPFAALDALTREQLYGDLQRIWKSRRKTIVFVTHNVREAVCLGDRVLLFSPHPGRVQEEFIIELPRPRDLNSVELATYASRITHALKSGAQSEAAMAK